MNKAILRFLLLFKTLFTRFNVDVNQLEIILLTKLRMDDRRPNNLISGTKKKTKKESKNVSWTTMLMMGFVGLFMVVILFFFRQPLSAHTVYFSVLMIMLALTLISDFTTVLIDVRDNFIILPRPVNDRTFIVSRILHITIHVSKLVLALTLPGLIYIIVAEGILPGTVFVVEVISATFLSIFLVNIIYLVVLKVSSPDRFKDFISYFQIIFSMVIFGLYYLMPRLIDVSVIKKINILDYPGVWLLPPAWISALHELVNPQAVNNYKIYVAATLAVVFPLLCLYLVVKVLAPGFNRKLSSISGSSQDDNNVLKKKAVKKGLMHKISSNFVKDPIEQAGFRLTWLLSARYRDFKVKVYPAFAYVPIYFVYFALSRKNNLSLNEKFSTLQEGKVYLLLLYLSGMILISVLNQVSYSEKPKSAWILFTTPYDQPGRFLSGMFKAIIIKYYIPYYLIIGFISFYIWGFVIWNDLLLVFFNTLVYGIATSWILIKYMPFSQPQNLNLQGGQFIKGLLILIIPAILGLIHYFLSDWEWAINAWLPFSIALAMYLMHVYRARSWDSVINDVD